MNFNSTKKTEERSTETLSESSSGGIKVLRATGAFGVRGLVRAKLFSDNIKLYKKIYTSDGRSFAFRTVRYDGGNSVIIALDGINDRDQASALKGTVFYVSRDDLKTVSATAANEYYVCDLIGKPIKVIGGENISGYKISNVYNFGAGELIEISYKDGTFLIPFTKTNFPQDEIGKEILITVETFTCYRN